MLSKIKLIKNTVVHLKPTQIKYQLIYRMRKKHSVDRYMPKSELGALTKDVRFRYEIPQIEYYLGGNRFRFLNIEHQFGNNIEWDYDKYGKLWNYNLQYANWLLQDDVPLEERVGILKSLLGSIHGGVIELEPYPVSLRSINIIRFVSKYKINDEVITNHLYGELNYLNRNLEFHILGNHLLENLFALVMGAALFDNKAWHDKAIKLISRELGEQILGDGAHFELSPMYHQIMFYRLLELIDWYEDFDAGNKTFIDYCRGYACRMLRWLNNISFENGDIPLFNDAANGIAFTTKQLNEYAAELKIGKGQNEMSNSGYRSFVNDVYEVKIDFAQIGASYQPGHAHADALGFILYHKGEPLFVEQGTSTYQIGKRRNLERSTEAHNCVVVQNTDQSEVWGGFRTGRRAVTTIINDGATKLEAMHDGYKAMGVIHTRAFELDDNEIIISDKLSKESDAVFYLHIHHAHKIKQLSFYEFLTDSGVLIEFSRSATAVIERYKQSEEYNIYNDAYRLRVAFKSEMSCRVRF